MDATLSTAGSPTRSQRAYARLRARSTRFAAALALSVGILTAGAFTIVKLDQKQARIVAVDGTAPAASVPAYEINFAIGGSAPRNFVSSAPAGAAFLSWRYNQPVALQSFTHTVIGPFDPAKVMRSLSLQYRARSGLWVEAVTGEWPAAESNTTHSFALPLPHTIMFAEEWRIVALAGGGDGELNMGWISPTRHPPMPGKAEFRENLTIDKVLLLTVLLAAGAWAVFFPTNAGPILFLGGCLATVTAVNFVVFALLRLPLLWAPDTFTYLAWPPDPARTPGITAILQGLVAVFGFGGTHVFQINLMLVAYLTALALVATASKRFWPFVPLAILPYFWGPFVVHASWLLSEPYFISGFLVGISGVIAVILGSGWVIAAIAGFGFLLALCAKSVAVVLIVPALLSYRFFPGSPWQRRLAVGLLIVPSLLGYLAMSAVGYTLNGRFSPTTFGGHALLGQVAWMLDADDVAGPYHDVARDAVAHAQASYGEIPPITDPDRYIDHTTWKFNLALNGIVARFWEAANARGNSAEYRARYAEVNDVFTSWAVKTIARHPVRYLTHCALHFWGLWRDSLSAYYTIGQARWMHLIHAYVDMDPADVRQRSESYNSYRSAWRADHEPRLAGIVSRPLMIIDASGHRFQFAFALMVLALILSALYLLPITYPPLASAMIVWSLVVNAYVAGQALFQVTLVRYGEMIVPLLPLLAGLVLLGLCDGIWRLWGKLQPGAAPERREKRLVPVPASRRDNASCSAT